ncbi:MAG: DUF1269 domain-containing protein [Acidobacteriota bacterium]
MKPFAGYASQALGVNVPEDYAVFMETYGKRLSADPVHETSWIGGLGSADFVVGTTLAFRSMFKGFHKEYMVIGYIGTKRIVVNRSYEDLDEYLMLDSRDGSVHVVDSLGISSKICSTFEEWVTPELLRTTLREKYSSNLTVVVFDDELNAEEARLKLLKLQREGFVEVEDAVVVVKDQDGAVRYHQMHKQARKGGLAGSITGLIVGSIFFTPLLGAAVGAVTGAISASLGDVGVDDEFMKNLSEKFKPGCSALFTLVRKADPQKVGDTFLGFGGKVLVSSVSKERETAIQALLDGTIESAD